MYPCNRAVTRVRLNLIHNYDLDLNQAPRLYELQIYLYNYELKKLMKS